MTHRDRVLGHFGVMDAPLGQGAEAWVYPMPDDQVLRIPKKRSNEGFENRARLLERLAPGAARAGMVIPKVLDAGMIDGSHWSIESRIPGRELGQALAVSKDRRALISAYMEAAAGIGDLLTGEDYRELWVEPPLVAATGPELLYALASRALGWAEFDIPVPELPDFDGPPELVQLDFFPGNVMAEGERITGVIDFGFATILADRRLTPLVAAASLRFRSDATEEELAHAEALAGAANVPRVRKWLAAYWSFAIKDDPGLARWARPELEETDAD